MDYDNSDLDDFDYYSDSHESGYENSDSSLAVDHAKRLLEDRIHQALAVKDFQEFKDILPEDYDIDSANKTGWSLLMHAALDSLPDFIEFLLKRGAGVNKRYYEGMTPLMSACQSSCNQTISNYASVKLLLNNGAQINVMDRHGQTPLMKAIETGKTDVVNLLLEKANLEATDSSGRTAVFYAVQYDRSDILKILIEKGAKLDIADKNQCKLRNIAVDRDHEPTLKLLNEFLPEVIEYTPLEFYMYTTIEKWEDWFPNMKSSNKLPAYWNEIPCLLHGMYCDTLIPLFKEKQIDLFTTLTLTEDEIQDKIIMMDIYKNRLLNGLYKFHSHPWNMNTIDGLGIKNDPKIDTYLNYLGSHFKQLTIIYSTITYIEKMIQSNKYDGLPKTLDVNVNKIVNDLMRLKTELQKVKKTVTKINKENIPIGDMITPPKKKRRLSKKSLILFSVTVYFLFKWVKPKIM